LLARTDALSQRTVRPRPRRPAKNSGALATARALNCGISPLAVSPSLFDDLDRLVVRQVLMLLMEVFDLSFVLPRPGFCPGRLLCFCRLPFWFSFGKENCARRVCSRPGRTTPVLAELSVLISPDVRAPPVTVLHSASDEVTCGRRYRNGSDQNSYIDRDW
jgi:hypothetical protein